MLQPGTTSLCAAASVGKRGSQTCPEGAAGDNAGRVLMLGGAARLLTDMFLAFQRLVFLSCLFFLPCRSEQMHPHHKGVKLESRGRFVTRAKIRFFRSS